MDVELGGRHGLLSKYGKRMSERMNDAAEN